MGITDGYTSLFKFHPAPVHVNTTNKPIRAGVWGLVFVIFYIVSISLLFIFYPVLGVQPNLCFCFPVLLIIAVIPALLLTILSWLLWHVFNHFYPPQGLQIAQELGKFEHTPEGWTFSRHLVGRKTALDTESSSPHILVIGGTQTGKSSTIKTIMMRMLGENGNVILDYHGEYRFLADRGFTVVNARDYNPLAPNYEGEDAESIVSDFVETFLVAFEATGEVQLAILKKKLMETPDIQAALVDIRRDAAAARSFVEKDRLTGLYLRLEKIAGYAGGNDTLRQLVKENGNVVFDFSSIRDRDAADFYAESILRRYLALLIEARQPTNIVIDEAHRLNTRFLAEKGCETSTVRIAREAGKFGGRLIVASQNLTDFPPGFSANFGNLICFRIPAGADMSVLQNMSGISPGLLQSVMNGLKKGEALLIGPHDHYAVVKITMPQEFPQPGPKSHSEAVEPEAPAVDVLPGQSVTPHVTRKEEMLQMLKGSALTVTDMGLRLNTSPHAIWERLQRLVKSGQVIRYEEVEIPRGIEIFYELSDPSCQESDFHKVLIEKAHDELSKVGTVKILSRWGNPDLIFNERIAIEVEACTRLRMDEFVPQVKKRFTQGYGAVIVVVINKKHKKPYEQALAGIKNIGVVTLRELSKTVTRAKT